MITDDHVDKLYAEIYKKDVEIARLNAEVARLLELMERLLVCSSLWR